MSKAEFDKISHEYVNAATIHGMATIDGDHKTANKQTTVLKNIYKKLETDKALAENLIDDLFEQGNVSIKIWASAHALGLNIQTDEAAKILNQYSRDESIGILGLTAEMTLREWKKKGTLKF